MNLARKGLAVALCGAMAAGCASMSTQQARKVKPSGFLGEDAALLQKGGEGQALLRYEAPDVDWKAYQAFYLEPVQYWTEYHGKLPAKDKKQFTGYMHDQLREQLSKRLKPIPQPAPSTLKIAVALVDARGSKVVLDTVSNVTPVGLAVSSIKEEATGKPSAVGEVQAEMKIIDSQTGKLLAEAVDRRVGAKTFEGKFKKWDDVEAACRYWAYQTAYRLCTLQDGANCVEPSTAPELQNQGGTSR